MIAQNADGVLEKGPELGVHSIATLVKGKMLEQIQQWAERQHVNYGTIQEEAFQRMNDSLPDELQARNAKLKPVYYLLATISEKVVSTEDLAWKIVKPILAREVPWVSAIPNPSVIQGKAIEFGSKAYVLARNDALTHVPFSDRVRQLTQSIISGLVK